MDVVDVISTATSVSAVPSIDGAGPSGVSAPLDNEPRLVMHATGNKRVVHFCEPELTLHFNLVTSGLVPVWEVNIDVLLIGVPISIFAEFTF